MTGASAKTRWQGSAVDDLPACSGLDGAGILHAEPAAAGG